MEYMEAMMQAKYEAGEKHMEYLCELADKIDDLIKQEGISIDVIVECIDLHKTQEWRWYKKEDESKKYENKCTNCGEEINGGFCGCIPF